MKILRIILTTVLIIVFALIVIAKFLNRNSDVEFNKGVAADQQNKTDDAIAKYREAIRLNKDNGHAPSESRS